MVAPVFGFRSIGSKRFIAYGASEEPVIANHIESNESKASISEENFSLFASVPSAGSAFRASEYNSYDSLSGCAADFQSVNKHEGLKSSEPMDSDFGQAKDQKAGKLEDCSERAPSTADWMQDDLSQQVEHIQVVKLQIIPHQIILTIHLLRALISLNFEKSIANIISAPSYMTMDEHDD